MRFIFTTIILTMLAQPVWANAYLADKFCTGLWARLHGTLDAVDELQRAWLETTIIEERDQIGDKMDSVIENAANVATVINVLCNE